MKNRFIKYVGIILILPCMGIPLSAIAHESRDHQSQSVKIEKVSSNSGSPVDIHIELTKKVIIVTGKIKRKIHRHQKVRGHVDIDLLDEQGKIINHVTTRLIPLSIKVSRSRFSLFISNLPLPETDNYTIRITHTTHALSHTS